LEEERQDGGIPRWASWSGESTRPTREAATIGVMRGHGAWCATRPCFRGGGGRHILVDMGARKTATTARGGGALASLEQVYAPDRAAWRRWLARHHATSPGIWLVFDKKASRPDRLAYADAVEEALCFGWVDSLVRTLDAARYVQLMTPRKPKSTWSRSNKERIERLTALGLMAEAGIAAVERAKANGSWSSLDQVESLTVPDDLAAALAATPDAAANFAAFSRSARFGYLHWISQAVRPETRARRVAEVVRHAAANRKARQLEGAGTPTKLGAKRAPAKAAAAEPASRQRAAKKEAPKKKRTSTKRSPTKRGRRA
jgi:uncharacterized protein YdeI (YjbR/CyaY-like superfamily)